MEKSENHDLPKQQANCDFAADVFAIKTQLYMEEIKIKQRNVGFCLSAFL